VIFDFERRRRIWLDETVFASGKTSAQVAEIVRMNLERSSRLLVTRLDATKFEALPAEQRAQLDYCDLSHTAILGSLEPPRGSAAIAVLAAGTSDLPVSREAVRTLRYYGQSCTEWNDIGVAGIWRLLERLGDIKTAAIVIVVAGMDAALVSIVGGLVPGVVIAVPTSIGYGIAAGGTTAVNSSLSSCAPGVTVVNIDNGYGAACAALRIIHAFAEPRAGANPRSPLASQRRLVAVASRLLRRLVGDRWVSLDNLALAQVTLRFLDGLRVDRTDRANGAAHPVRIPAGRQLHDHTVESGGHAPGPAGEPDRMRERQVRAASGELDEVALVAARPDGERAVPQRSPAPQPTGELEAGHGLPGVGAVKLEPLRRRHIRLSCAGGHQ